MPYQLTCEDSQQDSEHGPANNGKYSPKHDSHEGNQQAKHDSRNYFPVLVFIGSGPAAAMLFHLRDSSKMLVHETPVMICDDPLFSKKKSNRMDAVAFAFGGATQI